MYVINAFKRHMRLGKYMHYGIKKQQHKHVFNLRISDFCCGLVLVGKDKLMTSDYLSMLGLKSIPVSEKVVPYLSQSLNRHMPDFVKK